MKTPIKMLVINPGSTSTKVSFFEDEKNVYTESIFHDAPELLQFPTTNDQMPMRRQVILDFLRSHGLAPADMDVFVGRGGCAYSQRSGVMELTEGWWRILPLTRAGATTRRSWGSCWPMRWARNAASPCTP